MARQYGDTEYGLYAIVTIVCLAFGDDPCKEMQQYIDISSYRDTLDSDTISIHI